MLSAGQKKSLRALISMMDEPDEKIFHTLKDQVLSFKMDAYPLLEDAWLAANDLLVTNRLEELMEEVTFHYIYEEMEIWLNGQEHNLLRPMLLINLLQVPGSDISFIEKEIEILVRDAWLEINENLTALEKIKVLNHIFYTVHQYESPKVADETLSPFFLSHLLKNKTGNPTSMGILYLIIGQFLELPLFGVNLPGHLILSYVNDRFKLKDKKKYNSADVMFYVNPFNNGAVFTKSEIELYIKQLKISPKEKYYLPSDNISIIKRYLKELEKLYKLNKLDSKLSFIQRLSDLFYKY